MKSTKTMLQLAATLAFALLISGSFTQAGAQTDDGEFDRGTSAPPENDDSELVPGLRMALPSYAGSGCPAGSASATLSPDQKTLTLLFDSYVAQAGRGSGSARAQAGCQVRIPFQVPSGYRVQVVSLDYRGYASVPQSAQVGVTSSLRFLNGGAGGPPFQVTRRKTLQGPIDENFLLSSRVHGKKWSACGQAVTLSAESSLTAISNSRGDDVLSTIDSMDAVAMPVRVGLRWRKCKDKGPNDDDEYRPGRGNGRGPQDRPGRPHPGRGHGHFRFQ
jgi:hypothetical protein